MSVYYNDNDEFCCAWLRELMKEGLIADGVVDNRSIRDVDPRDLEGFSQVHFFAGIGWMGLCAWLLGFPVGWGNCEVQVMRSARRSPRRLSKHSSKAEP